ncbi:MAG: beta-ketoacyl synthase N-terminal-like domain-containing protein, partial [Planctomycetaceae bacterium]
MQDSIAIVGMACRLPGADGLEAFWDLVVRGGTAWGRLPESRLPRELYFDPEKGKVGRSYSDLGALVSERPADPAVCPLRPDMLDRYDVAHHVFLEVASLACRDAGLDPFAMPRARRTGVYVGHTGGSTRIGDYVYSTGIDGTAAWLSEVEAARELLGPEADGVGAEVTDAVRRAHPGRRPGEKLDLGALGAAKIVREGLGLEGPYLVVDAACASSLQALAIAARALRQGGIDQAIVGGASYCKSDSLVLFSAAQSVSNTGSCPFGRDADGLVTAEGYVALVIKTLSRAIADGDRIRAVIRGIGVSSDGKGKSLWAPRQEGQKLAVERAYPDRGEIGRLDYIEAHATSTQVGDATELGALATLLSANLPAGKKIPIGSVKANIGHTLETAGMASLVKVVLALEHDLIPPGSTCADYNDDFDWASGPFTVPRAALAWPKRADGEARRCAVNAFGIGGLNVHLAIVEHMAGAGAAPARPRAAADDAVAIVGIGGVLPGALTAADFHTLLESGGSALAEVPAERWSLARALDASGPRPWKTTGGLGGFVRGFAYDWRRHKVPPKQIAAANPLQFMLLEAADAAIAEVGGVAALDRVRTGVVVGTMFGGEFSNDLQMGLRLPETSRHLRAALERRGVVGRDADRVVEAYGKKLLEKMPALVDETGSFTSSTLASRLTKSFDLMGGALALDSGDCSAVSALAAAVDLLRVGECDAVLCAAGQRYLDLMAFEGLSIDGMICPAPRSAFDVGRPGRVPGEGAVVLVLKRLADARAAGNRIHGVIRGVAVSAAATPQASVEGAVRAARLQAGLAPAAVTAAEFVASGHVETDGLQLRGVAGEYGPALVGGGVEGAVGHLGAVSAAAGIVKLSRVLERGSMPPTLGAPAQPSPSVAPAPLAVPAADASGYRAGCVTVAHDHQVGHVVMDNGLPVPAAVRDGGRAEVAVRPATVAPLAAPGAAPSATRPLVAALFPGQGSQYADMFRDLVATAPAVKACLDILDGEVRAAGLGTLADTAWRADHGLGVKVWDTQWSMFLGDLLAWRVLEGAGFTPDVIASHSFGEFPSLVAAGAWSFAAGATATAARAEAVERHGPRDGAMLSVIAPRAEVEAAIAPFAGQVWVCAANAPEQSVVGGHARAVDAVELVLEGKRVRSKRLAVPSPFHTPLLSAAAVRLGEAIDRLPIVAPSRRVYSSTTAAVMASPAEVRHSLIQQMTQTVRWVEVVERLWEEGVRTFVEVGPSGVLTGLTRRILEGRAGATFIQFDQRGRDAAAHLAKVLEQLSASGALSASPAASGRSPAAGSEVVGFDATARRRARNRSGGAATPAAPRPAAGPARSAAPSPAASHGGYGSNGSHGNGHAHGGGNGHAAPAIQTVTVEPVPVPV